MSSSSSSPTTTTTTSRFSLFLAEQLLGIECIRRPQQQQEQEASSSLNNNGCEPWFWPGQTVDVTWEFVHDQIWVRLGTVFTVCNDNDNENNNNDNEQQLQQYFYGQSVPLTLQVLKRHFCDDLGCELEDDDDGEFQVQVVAPFLAHALRKMNITATTAASATNSTTCTRLLSIPYPQMEGDSATFDIDTERLVPLTAAVYKLWTRRATAAAVIKQPQEEEEEEEQAINLQNVQEIDEILQKWQHEQQEAQKTLQQPLTTTLAPPPPPLSTPTTPSPQSNKKRSPIIKPKIIRPNRPKAKHGRAKVYNPHQKRKSRLTFQQQQHEPK